MLRTQRRTRSTRARAQSTPTAPSQTSQSNRSARSKIAQSYDESATTHNDVRLSLKELTMGFWRWAMIYVEEKTVCIWYLSISLYKSFLINYEGQIYFVHMFYIIMSIPNWDTGSALPHLGCGCGIMTATTAAALVLQAISMKRRGTVDTNNSVKSGRVISIISWWWYCCCCCCCCCWQSWCDKRLSLLCYQSFSWWVDWGICWDQEGQDIDVSEWCWG